MKKIFLILVFAVVYTNSNGQHNDTIILSVLYKVNLLNNGRILQDSCQLDITKNKSHFYSLNEVYNNIKLEEPAILSTIQNGLITAESLKIKQTINKKILKDRDSNLITVIEKIGFEKNNYYAYTKSGLSNNNWTLLNDTIIIGSYLCHKAIKKIDTTEIVAWYTTEIPINEGPLLNYGLPGLILKTESSTGSSIVFQDIIKNKPNSIKLLQKTPAYTLSTEKELIRYRKALLEKIKTDGVIEIDGHKAKINFSKP